MAGVLGVRGVLGLGTGIMLAGSCACVVRSTLCVWSSAHLCEHWAEDGRQVVGVRRGNWVTPKGHLHQGQAEAPEVGGHAVLRALQPLG